LKAEGKKKSCAISLLDQEDLIKQVKAGEVSMVDKSLYLLWQRAVMYRNGRILSYWQTE